tara:strand:+ start:48 stop:362 length:315 start_codon:yes stop_codon:yes gene_type:complete
MNRLTNAYERKQERAEKIESKFEDKKAKLGEKIGKAKSKAEWERKFGRIGKSEEKTYGKIKKIEGKGIILKERAKEFTDRFEKEKKVKEELESMKKMTNPKSNY